MGIFNKDGTTQGQSTKKQITKGGGTGIFTNSKSGLTPGSDAEITVIAGDVSNATTRVLDIEAGTNVSISATEDARTTTVTINADPPETGIVHIWDIDSEYQQGELAHATAASTTIYISTQIDNRGNALTDTNYWLPINTAISIDDTMVDNNNVYGVDTEVIADTEFVKDWVRNTGVHSSRYFKVEDDAADNAAAATGEDATAIGPNTNASGQFALAIGNDVEATNNGALGIGNATDATGIRSVAVGDRAQATDTDTLAMGDNATASAKEDVSIGSNTVASGERSVAMGSYVTASGVESVALGAAKGTNHEDRTIASGPNSIAIGTGAEASGVDATAIGEDAEATDTDAIAIGDGAEAGAENAIAIGGASATGVSSIAIGKGASTSTDNKMEIAGINDIQINDFHGDTDQYIVVGTDGVWSLRNLVPGHDINVDWIASENTTAATATADNSLALGGGASAQDSEATAVGTIATAAGERSIALGYGATVINTAHDRSIVIGHGTSTTDSELSIFGVNKVRLPSFTGGTGQFLAVDANGNVTAATPADTTYTAGYGLSLTDTEFKADTDVLASRAWADTEFAPLSTFYTNADLGTAIIDTNHQFQVFVNESDRKAFVVDDSQDLIAYKDSDTEVPTIIWDANNNYIPKAALEPNAFSETINFKDERADTDWDSGTLICDTSTGFEFVRDSNGDIRLQEYVPTPNFAISLANGTSNRSWFNAVATDSVTVSASAGTLTSITSATVNSSSTDVTINNTNNTVTYPVNNANGLYELVVNASGTNADSVAQTDSASHSWRVYADFWLATNQSGADAAFSTSAGRSSNRFTTGDITAVGYTFLTVSADEFSGTFQFRTALGNLVVQTPTTFDITLGGVTKSYKRYYLGNFSNSTTITVSGG